MKELKKEDVAVEKFEEAKNLVDTAKEIKKLPEKKAKKKK